MSVLNELKCVSARPHSIIFLNRMTRDLCTFLLIFLILLPCTPIGAENIDEVFQTVAYLKGKDEVQTIIIDGTKYEIWLRAAGETKPYPYKKAFSGTGFFVRTDRHLYLITAEHVVKNLKYPVEVTVCGPEGKPLTCDMKDLTESGNEQSWFFHSEADVALLPLDLSEKFEGIIKVLEPSFFQTNEDEYGQYRNRELTTIGFPLNLGLSGNFSPITKSSKVASNLFRHRRADKNIETTFLILDDPSVQGFSGAPVYALSKLKLRDVTFRIGPFICVGLVHGSISDNTGGKFAAIVPGYFIIQTIEHFENRK